MVNSKATKLLDYYNRWTIAHQLSPEPVRCDEFEVGRTSYVMHMPMGKKGSLERLKFQSFVYHPAILYTCTMKSFLDVTAPPLEEVASGEVLEGGDAQRKEEPLERAA